MAVGQTEPLDSKEGKKRVLPHWFMWGAIPATAASLMREFGAGEPNWKWIVAGGLIQGGVTVGRELWEKKQGLQTGGKMAWDLGSKLVATAMGWGTFNLLW